MKIKIKTKNRCLRLHSLLHAHAINVLFHAHEIHASQFGILNIFRIPKFDARFSEYNKIVSIGTERSEKPERNQFRLVLKKTCYRLIKPDSPIY